MPGTSSITSSTTECDNFNSESKVNDKIVKFKDSHEDYQKKMFFQKCETTIGSLFNYM